MLDTEAEEAAPPPEAEAPVGQARAPRRSRTEWIALGLHLASLVAAFLLIAYVDRGMWFRGDDFDFLAQRGLHGATKSIWLPHNVHWSTLPVLLWRAIFVFAKLRTARPYLMALYVVHLALAHVLWRAMRSTGSGPYVATGLAALFAVLGAGAENVVWAFQIGFVSSLLLGWIAALLLNHETPSLWRDLAAIAVGIAALMTSGVAVTMVALGAAVALARRGWRAFATYAVPCAAVYLVWFALIGHEGRSPTMGARATLLALPHYVMAGLANSLSAASGSTDLGPALLMAVVLFAAWRAGREGRSAAAPALLAVAGPLVFFAITAIGRDSFGPREADASRYVYISVALLLPAIGLGVTALVRASRGVGAAALAVLALVGVWNVGQLLDVRSALVAVSQQTERQTIAAAQLGAQGPTVPNALPLGNVNAPNITLVVLEQLYRQGALPSGVTPQPADVLAAATQLQLGFTGHPAFPTSGATVVSTSAGFRRVNAGGGCRVLTAPAHGGQLDVGVTSPVSMRLTPASGVKSVIVATLQLGSGHGAPTPFTLHTGAPWWNIAASPSVVQLSLPAGDTARVC
jgi:hypothetical protein